MQVQNLGLSDATVQALLARGIANLFPIQKMVGGRTNPSRVQHATRGGCHPHAIPRSRLAG
jgi:hypothetical protein